jgi:hypothetical protein
MRPPNSDCCTATVRSHDAEQNFSCTVTVEMKAAERVTVYTDGQRLDLLGSGFTRMGASSGEDRGNPWPLGQEAASENVLQ